MIVVEIMSDPTEPLAPLSWVDLICDRFWSGGDVGIPEPKKLPARHKKYHGCLFPNGPLEFNEIKAIHIHDTKRGLNFMVHFVHINLILWVNFRILKKLEPKTLWPNYVQRLYLFHRDLFDELLEKFNNEGLGSELEKHVEDIPEDYSISSNDNPTPSTSQPASEAAISQTPASSECCCAFRELCQHLAGEIIDPVEIANQIVPANPTKREAL